MSDFNTLAVNHYTTVIHHKEGKPRVLLSDLNSSQSTEASTKFAQLTSSPESLSLKIREQVSSEKRQNESYFNNFMAPSICCFQQEWRLLWQFVCVCMFFFFFLWMHKNFRIICFSSVKNILGILIGIALNLQIDLSTAAAAKLLQSCPNLCDPRDGSPPGSPIPGILQARTLECVAISFSNA